MDSVICCMGKGTIYCDILREIVGSVKCRSRLAATAEVKCPLDKHSLSAYNSGR